MDTTTMNISSGCEHELVIRSLTGAFDYKTIEIAMVCELCGVPVRLEIDGELKEVGNGVEIIRGEGQAPDEGEFRPVHTQSC